METSFNNYCIRYLLCLFFLHFPFLGLLADVCIGRYNAITIGIIMCFISWILEGIVTIINDFKTRSLVMIVGGVAYLFEIAGYAAFRANIVQYNVAQIIGASASELSTLIYWHSL